MKRTIAENRERALERFNAEYIHDMDAARHIVNIYYRFVPLEIRNLENDTEQNQTRAWYKYELEKETRMYNRLKALLKPYGLELFTAWIHSSIVKPSGEHGGVVDALDTYFYN